MTLLSISSCPAALLCFTDLKAFSNSSKVRSLYSIFFCTGNRKSSNVLDVFCILLARFGPTFVKYLLNSSAMRLFFFIDFPLTFIDLGNLLELTLHFPVIYFTIGFHVKASLASRPVSRLIRWYKKPGDITKEFWEKAIQFHEIFHGLKITNCNCLFTTSPKIIVPCDDFSPSSFKFKRGIPPPLTKYVS